MRLKMEGSQLRTFAPGWTTATMFLPVFQRQHLLRASIEMRISFYRDHAFSSLSQTHSTSCMESRL